MLSSVQFADILWVGKILHLSCKEGFTEITKAHKVIQVLLMLTFGFNVKELRLYSQFKQVEPPTNMANWDFGRAHMSHEKPIGFDEAP